MHERYRASSNHVAYRPPPTTNGSSSTRTLRQSAGVSGVGRWRCRDQSMSRAYLATLTTMHGVVSSEWERLLSFSSHTAIPTHAPRVATHCAAPTRSILIAFKPRLTDHEHSGGHSTFITYLLEPTTCIPSCSATLSTYPPHTSCCFDTNTVITPLDSNKMPTTPY